MVSICYTSVGSDIHGVHMESILIEIMTYQMNKSSQVTHLIWGEPKFSSQLSE